MSTGKVNMIFKFKCVKEFGKHRYKHANDSARTLLGLMKRQSLTETQVNYIIKQGWDVRIL